MKSRQKQLFVLSLIILYCIIARDAGALLELKVADKPGSRRTAPGELIVEVKRGVLDLGKEKGIAPQELVIIKSGSLEALNKKYGLISIEKLFSGTRKDAPSDIYVLRFSPQTDIDELVSAYRQDSSIIYAEPNYLVRISPTLDTATLDTPALDR